MSMTCKRPLPGGARDRICSCNNATVMLIVVLTASVTAQRGALRASIIDAASGGDNVPVDVPPERASV